MPIITLTTDLGLRDPALAALKGNLLSTCENVILADITHTIKPFEISEAAYVLKHAYKSFPKKTIHIIYINTEESAGLKTLLIQYNDHYFIGVDNGIFSLLCDSTPDNIFITEENGASAKSIILNSVADLYNNQDINAIGSPTRNFVSKKAMQPVISENMIRGSVNYIDNYENVITNISMESFQRIGRERKFTVNFKRNMLSIPLAEKYYEVPEGEIIYKFNAYGDFQISINKGRAAGLLGLKLGDIVQIDFL